MLSSRRAAAWRLRRHGVHATGFLLVLLVTLPATAADDWDLYMLRLVNRARQNPAAEAANIGSSVVDNQPPVPPLAYHEFVGQAAMNHNTWMHDNFGGIATSFAPDSFTHYETLDGTPEGAPATGTPNFTGYDIGDRLFAAGFDWGWAGENIRAAVSTVTIPVNQATIDAAHKGWWESSGHRDNMLFDHFTVFGHRAESRAFTPPRGNISAPYDNLHYATQDFGRPFVPPYTHVFGLLYDDLDGNGAWTPRDSGHPLREGVAGITMNAYLAGTSSLVASGVTMAHGAFTLRLGNGTYDLEFLLPGGSLVVAGVAISGANTDAGDIRAELPAGNLPDLVDCLAGPDSPSAPQSSGLSPQDCLELYDADEDEDVDLFDYAAFTVAFDG